MDRRPFEPFVVRLSSGVSHEVRHPETAVLTKNKLIVVYPETDGVAICALLHIASIGGGGCESARPASRAGPPTCQNNAGLPRGGRA